LPDVCKDIGQTGIMNLIKSVIHSVRVSVKPFLLAEVATKHGIVRIASVVLNDEKINISIDYFMPSVVRVAIATSEHLI